MLHASMLGVKLSVIDPTCCGGTFFWFKNVLVFVCLFLLRGCVFVCACVFLCVCVSLCLFSRWLFPLCIFIYAFPYMCFHVYDHLLVSICVFPCV